MKRIIITAIIGYLFMFILGLCLMMITEYFRPILVDYKYNMSYYLYFIDWVLPLAFKVSLYGLVAGAIVGWAIHSNHIEITKANSKYNAIKEHFGIDYPDKD